MAGTLAIANAATYTAKTAAEFSSALSSVQPGDTIILSGTITSSSKFSTARDGTSAAPITIEGDGTAVLTGSSSYGLEILHDYYRLKNFTIKNAAKGLVIDSANHGAADRVHIMDIRQEAFKIRNQSQYWVFTYCSARRTGTSGDFGEGFYVGQASSNWLNGTPDRSGYITFFNCYTTDTVNDGWDFKEGAHHIKVVNCTADFSGSVEPASGASHGSAGIYMRCDNVQVIKCDVVNLNNSDWAYRFSNTVVNSVDYGSSGNEVKQSAVNGGNVGLIFSESGTNAKVYTDYVENSSGGFYATGSATVATPSPSTFVEMTWSGEGGGIYGNLDANIGADGDPMSAPPLSQVAAPTFSPGGGTYSSTQSVTISTTTDGATIRYTIDGTTPTSTTGTVYSGPISISVTTTLKAIAYKSGMTDSSVTSATYTISTGGGSGSQNITITAGSDDAKQRASGTVVTNSWRHPLGYDGTEQLEIGLRFPGLNVPRSATVAAAWIQFEADKSNSGASSLRIRGEKSANAATFTTATNSITNRPVTTASVSWAPPNWTVGERGAGQRTPDLKAIIQEIVNQSTWNAGNAVVFVIDGTGTRTAEASESGSAKAPQLHVEWQ